MAWTMYSRDCLPKIQKFPPSREIKFRDLIESSLTDQAAKSLGSPKQENQAAFHSSNDIDLRSMREPSKTQSELHLSKEPQRLSNIWILDRLASRKRNLSQDVSLKTPRSSNFATSMSCKERIKKKFK